MAEYARRSHRATVILQPGETKTFRLPPGTPGPVVIDAKVPPPIGGGWGLPRRRDRRDRGEALGPATPRTRRDTAGPAGPTTPTTADPTTARPRRPRPIGPGGILSGVDGVLDPGTHPELTPPTDLAIELVHGGRVVASHGSHIVLNMQTHDDARNLRLTREPGGTGEQTYFIEVNYPSVLPIVTRRVSPIAFQRAFDANWNQHQYVAVELSPHYHVYVKFDAQFAALYGLEDLDIDLGVPSAVPNIKRVSTTDIRFTMEHGDHPFPDIVTPHKVPIVRLHIAVKIEDGGDSFIDVRFFLTSFGGDCGFITQVKSPMINAAAAMASSLPAYDITPEEISDKIANKISAMGQARFGRSFTPWIVGEPDRDLWGLSFDTGRNEIVVKYVGRPPPPRDDLVIAVDPGGSAPAPNTNPRLFDTPDEIPPPPIEDDPMRRPYITSAGSLAAIQNIVVLMQENRSFDQVLGYLSREAGRTDVDGLSPDPQGNWNRYDGGDGERIYYAQRAPTTRWFGYQVAGPGHHHDDIVSQMSDGMRHFVSNFAKRVGNDRVKLQRIMDYFGPDQLPAYAALAQGFAICHRWFTSHVGSTWPNRFVTFTGDLNRDREGDPELDNPHVGHLVPITRTTLFDHLTARGVTWKVYEHGYCFLRLYGKYTFDFQNIVSFNDPDVGFVADARAGRLPQVAFIEPDYVDLPPGNDDHPPSDMADGQRFIATIASALLESPQWERLLFLITYDEHGGFYDHVLPPDGPALAGNMRQYGPRVPTFVMSPWVAGASVFGSNEKVYDHTTIAATILRRFCSPSPPRMSARADAAHDLRDIILPAARPRPELDAVYNQLVAVRNTPAPAPQPPPRLAPWTEPDDFHKLISYVRTFT